MYNLLKILENFLRYLLIRKKVVYHKCIKPSMKRRPSKKKFNTLMIEIFLAFFETTTKLCAYIKLHKDYYIYICCALES